MAKRKSTYPLPLADESAKEFRLRACVWLIQKHGGLTYDGLVAKFNSTYAKELNRTNDSYTFATTKESITRSMKTLEARQLAHWDQDGDGRYRVWTLTEQVA